MGSVVFLKADYTAYSEDIAQLLHQFNAPSVPLYVIYPAGKPDAPVVLPDALDPANRARRPRRRPARPPGKPVAAR